MGGTFGRRAFDAFRSFPAVRSFAEERHPGEHTQHGAAAGGARGGYRDGGVQWRFRGMIWLLSMLKARGLAPAQTVANTSPSHLRNSGASWRTTGRISGWRNRSLQPATRRGFRQWSKRMVRCDPAFFI